MLSEKDYGPMLVNVLLILIGTPFAVWLMANPDSIAAARTWLDANDVLWKVGMFIAVQPLMVIFWFWMKRRVGPFSIQREDDKGNWHTIATSDSLKQAKELAHDKHRRVINLHSLVVYHGR